MNGIQRITDSFLQGKKFVAYLTAGDGGMRHTLSAARALIKGGVNMLEIGVPFSDPIADGPVIQRASRRALNAKTTLLDVLWLVQEIRQQSEIPLILFSYLNPILAQLNASFCREAALAGVDGVLIVDCPMEESTLFHETFISHQIAPIYVISPSTPVSRLRKIDRYGKGFLYYACRKGTTGIQAGLPEDFGEKMQQIKSWTQLPVVAGFGIAERQVAEDVLRHADGVVVGSLFVKALEDGMQAAELTRFAKNINPLVRQSYDSDT